MRSVARKNANRIVKFSYNVAIPPFPIIMQEYYGNFLTKCISNCILNFMFPVFNLEYIY